MVSVTLTACSSSSTLGAGSRFPDAMASTSALDAISVSVSMLRVGFPAASVPDCESNTRVFAVYRGGEASVDAVATPMPRTTQTTTVRFPRATIPSTLRRSRGCSFIRTRREPFGRTSCRLEPRVRCLIHELDAAFARKQHHGNVHRRRAAPVVVVSCSSCARSNVERWFVTASRTCANYRSSLIASAPE